MMEPTPLDLSGKVMHAHNNGGEEACRCISSEMRSYTTRRNKNEILYRVKVFEKGNVARKGKCRGADEFEWKLAFPEYSPESLRRRQLFTSTRSKDVKFTNTWTGYKDIGLRGLSY